MRLGSVRPSNPRQLIGKALGLPEDITAALSAQVWGWSTRGVSEGQARS